MIGIGGTKLGNGPRVALAVSDREPLETLADRGIDVLELRVDQFADGNPGHVASVIQTRKILGVPMILTVRNDPAEGGVEGISEKEKLEIYKKLGGRVDAFDIELSSPIVEAVVRLAGKKGKPVIVSKHDFESTPPLENLEHIFIEARRKGADVFKMAAMPNDMEDVRTMLTFTMRHRMDHVITMSLGAVGSISRVLFPLAGSLLTYTFIGNPSAPGQIPLDRLQEQLRLYSPEYEKHFNRGRAVPEP